MAVNPERVKEEDIERNSDRTVNLPGGVDESDRQAAVRRYGLPEVINMPNGEVHTCGCADAELTHVSPMQPDGYVYSDYRCRSNWSNIFRFKVNQVRLDTNGNIIEQKDPYRAPGAKGSPKLA